KLRIMNRNFYIIIFCITFILSCSPAKQIVEHNVNMDMDYVPNEETAIKIAEAIWLPIYGIEVLDKKPYTAVLINDEIWRVQGTIGLDELGGVPYIEISKKDCKILKVTHGK